MKDPCKECSQPCCNDVWFEDNSGKKYPTCRAYLNHSQLGNARFVIKPNGNYRCMEYDYKTGLCTIYRNRPNLCKDHRCGDLQEWYDQYDIVKVEIL